MTGDMNILPRPLSNPPSTPAGNPPISLQQARAASVAALTQLDTTQLPVGTLLQGKVLSNLAMPQTPGQPAVYRLLLSVLNTALSGSTLSLDSPQPLPIGSLLSARVQGSQSLSFVPLANRQEQLAVAQQLLAQQSRQGSLDGLFNALQKLPAAETQPAGLRAAIDSLLSGLPDAQQLSTPKGLAQALANSGLFLEARLLAGANPALTQDLKGRLLQLIAQLPPGLPTPPLTAANTLAQALPNFVRNALGTLDQLSAKPQPSGFPLPARLVQSLEGEGDLEHLLRLAAAAVSRVQSHQLASLGQSGIMDDGRLQTTWQLEIPLRNLQDIVPVQVKLQREEPAEKEQQKKPGETATRQTLWRVELALDMEPLGPLQVQAQLMRGSLSGRLWAERPDTARLIERHLGGLRAQLLASGLNVGDLDCHLGTPPQGPQTRLEQRWVDETA